MLDKITIYTKSTGKLWKVFSKLASESTDGFAYTDKEMQKFYEQLSMMKNNVVLKNGEQLNGIENVIPGHSILTSAPEEPKQTVGDLLEEREHSYGDFMTNAILSQRLKSVMRESQNWDKLPMDMKESFEMMAVKIARLLNGDYTHIDGWRDCSGYSTLIADRLQKA